MFYEILNWFTEPKTEKEEEFQVPVRSTQMNIFIHGERKSIGSGTPGPSAQDKGDVFAPERQRTEIRDKDRKHRKKEHRKAKKQDREKGRGICPRVGVERQRPALGSREDKHDTWENGSL